MIGMEVAKELGQVFTSDKVARLMVGLARPRIGPGSRCLDPCIGKNVFFSSMDGLEAKELVGVEVDRSLITQDIENFYSRQGRKLHVENFFDFSTDEKFDMIIMNPPYVRQEKINGQINSKQRLRLLFADHEFKIPEKSNLYVYFFLKALKHLKDKGILVAITYDSWLFTAFGRSFKRYLTKHYDVEKVIHFRKGAFDRINVGATVILMSAARQRPKIEYFTYDSPDQLPETGSVSPERLRKITVDEFLSSGKLYPPDIDFSQELFTTLSRLSVKKISRGTNAIVNKLFLSDKEELPGHMIKMIKDVTRLRKFVVSEGWQYLLDINPEKMSEETKERLQQISFEVVGSDGAYKSLAKRMDENASWYKARIKEPGNIIFNYYMRDNIHFIYNPSFINSSDNFYSMSIKDDILENLCILNSDFTRYALLRYGRMQGHGLFKIQLYEFNDVPVIDISKLSARTKVELGRLGQKLLETDREKADGIIKEIDERLIGEYNEKTDEDMTVEKLRESIQKIRGGCDSG